jgi:signal transduction histidine kinase
LRNPLHVISAFSGFLLEDAGSELDEDLQEMLEIIRSSSQFMTRLVNDLLDVAKIESGKLDLHLEPTDLVALTQRIVNLNRPIAASKEIELHFDAEAIPVTQVDPDKITQVLNNLISNATKYSHPQSRVDIRLALDNRHILLSVEDEGQGIPADELTKLFRPFQRTSVTSTGGEKGTGLGLVIVKRIVEGHGGTLWLESEVGKGTVVYVSLPVNGDTVETGASL